MSHSTPISYSKSMPHPLPNFANFFALFAQPVAFSIDQDKLALRLAQLQKQFHPDSISTEGMGAAAAASLPKNSAMINHAYAVLRSPDSRAQYLLELAGQTLNSTHSIADLDFLEDAMEMRMTLDAAQSQHDLATLQALVAKVSERLHTQSERFAGAYQTQDWHCAIDATQKLTFLVKLQKDMASAIDSQHQPDHDNDDDLYL